MEKIKVFEMFAGYGGASFALKKAGIPHEVVGYSEIDKFAIQCYEQNHWNEEIEDVYEGYAYVKRPIYNYGDATKINVEELPDFDLLTGGFPCQAFSNAGKGLGELDTRGTLFNEIIRIAEVKKPKYMLLENVKGLTTKKHIGTFTKIISELNRIGYNVRWEVLNSKHYGIPQNRERVFIVCFRADLDGFPHKDFIFPPKEQLNIFIKDILEENVDKKYYLSEKALRGIEKSTYNTTKKRIQKGEICSILCARDYKDPKCIQLNNPTHSNNRVYSEEGLSPTLNTMQGGNRQPFIEKSERIRKLTPTECFRLMGFLDDEINLEGLSDTQKYKLAGNGWDINLVSKILTNMILINGKNI